MSAVEGVLVEYYYEISFHNDLRINCSANHCENQSRSSVSEAEINIVSGGLPCTCPCQWSPYASAPLPVYFQFRFPLWFHPRVTAERISVRCVRENDSLLSDRSEYSLSRSLFSVKTIAHATLVLRLKCRAAEEVGGGGEFQPPPHSI